MEDPEIVPFDNDVKQQIEDDSEVREATRVLPFRKQFFNFSQNQFPRFPEKLSIVQMKTLTKISLWQM